MFSVPGGKKQDNHHYLVKHKTKTLLISEFAS